MVINIVKLMDIPSQNLRKSAFKSKPYILAPAGHFDSKIKKSDRNSAL